MVTTTLKDKDRRFPTGQQLFLLLTAGGALLLLLFIRLYGYETVFTFLGVKAMSPCFLDLRTITAGSESHALGFDPLYQNPQDIFQRPLNYPRIWQLLFFFHLDQGDTIFLACGLILLFLLSLPLFTIGISRTTAVLLCAAIFSPAILLGVERANVDLLIFFLMSSALFMSCRAPIAAAILIQTGVVLKLYPLAGVFSLLGAGRKKFFVLSGVVCTFSLLYFVCTFSDLVQIQKATLKGIRLAYGIDVFRLAVETIRPSAGTVLRIGSWLLLMATVFLAIGTCPRKADSTASGNDNSINGFRMGSSIYTGTFLLGTNYNYRLMFLLFVIPQLVHWIRRPDCPIRGCSVLALVSIMFSLWSQFFARFPDESVLARGLFLADEFANWLAFGLLLQLWLYSLPDWLAKMFFFFRIERDTTGGVTSHLISILLLQHHRKVNRTRPLNNGID